MLHTIQSWPLRACGTHSACQCSPDLVSDEELVHLGCGAHCTVGAPQQYGSIVGDCRPCASEMGRQRQAGRQAGRQAAGDDQADVQSVNRPATLLYVSMPHLPVGSTVPQMRWWAVRSRTLSGKEGSMHRRHAASCTRDTSQEAHPPMPKPLGHDITAQAASAQPGRPD